jgi:hypothetical protein
MLAVPAPCGPPRRAVLPEGYEGWVVTRYADVRSVLADSVVERLMRTAGLRGVSRLRVPRTTTRAPGQTGVRTWSNATSLRPHQTTYGSPTPRM